MRFKLSRCVFSFAVVVLMLFVFQQDLAAQARCAFCQWQACVSGFSGFCQGGAVHSSCKRGAPDTDGCYTNCESHLGCASTLSAGDCVKQLRAVKLQSDQQTEDAEDEAIQADLVKNAARATKLVPQLDAPAMLISAVHSNHDLLKSARFMNMGNENIVGVRIGYSINSPNTSKERRVGEWVKLASPLQRDEVADIP